MTTTIQNLQAQKEELAIQIKAANYTTDLYTLFQNRDLYTYNSDGGMTWELFPAHKETFFTFGGMALSVQNAENVHWYAKEILEDKELVALFAKTVRQLKFIKKHEDVVMKTVFNVVDDLIEKR